MSISAQDASKPAQSSLPDIPDKRYFTISEASNLCGVKAHVLRYWEEIFAELKPQRRGNRRYYKKDDILLARRLRSLLHEQGYTINGAKRMLRDKKHLNVIDSPKPTETAVAAPVHTGSPESGNESARNLADAMLEDLENLARRLRDYKK